MSSIKRKIILIHAAAKRQVHHAGWIIVDSNTVIENGYIEVENQKIINVSSKRPKGNIIDHGPGVLMPPLVNAHLHLELSALRNELPFDKGFKHWVKTLLEKRNNLGEAKLIQEAHAAVENLQTSGTLYVGDISTLNITYDILENSILDGVCFHEFIGTQMDGFVDRKEEGFLASVAGHAPHSCSPQLLVSLKKKARLLGLPFSIHVAESKDEIDFIQDKKGSWADFLTSRDIDWSGWDVGGKTPVEHINDLGLLDSDTLLVHVLNANSNDMEIIAKAKTHVCVCPRSNLNLHQKLPDIEMMIANGISPALGTDSLASCDTLSIFDEMSFVKEKYPDIACKTIFSMGTENGAKALGLEQLTGTLAFGKKAHFLYLPANIKSKKSIFREIICND